MIKYFSALFCALLVLTLLDPIQCGKFSSRGSSRGSHSYPSSHSGLSGGSRHSGGLSGGGHGYPSSSGSRHTYPSSSGSHGYPSSSGSHGYPSSGGLSGGGSSYPSSGSKHTYPSSTSNKHTYPSSSGGHSYPSSGNGLSGSGHSVSTNTRYPTSNHRPTTVVTHHYHYNPPATIVYSPPGYRSVSYPVYRGSPPTYVYEYRNSGSKYSTLLAGLALFNLGALAGSAYGHSRSHQTYKAQPGESCRLGVKRANGDYEETLIDCMLMSSFIYEEEAKATGVPGATGTNSTTVTTTVTNTTVVNMTNPAPAPAVQTPLPPNTMSPPQAAIYQMLPNGTLVPVNNTAPGAANATVPGVNASAPAGANGTMTSSVTVTTTTTNTTVANALAVKGVPMQVTPTMDCFLIRTTPTSRMKKHISCGVLQSYATQSLKRNSAAHSVPTFTILFAIAAFVLY